MALIFKLSRPELRLLPAGDTGGRPMEFREDSTFNLDIASLNRLDMASFPTRQHSILLQGHLNHLSHQNSRATKLQKLDDFWTSGSKPEQRSVVASALSVVSKHKSPRSAPPRSGFETIALWR